jgi:hypothetical protein
MSGVTLIATLTPLPWVEIFGSGKSGTPCARTHAEYATAWLSGDDELPDPPLDPAAVVELVVDAFDVCDPRLATPPVDELPPQPVTSTLSAANAAVRKAARGRPLAALLRSSARFASPCMSSPLQLERSCSALLVRHRRFREGIAAQAAGSSMAKPCRNHRELAW